ncbi:hypothetical protein HDV02_006419 [Globomyces sp. JEL0801]|nr:hypothetical protein HDV02_006419 [Globomyces sp. JEL0801]
MTRKQKELLRDADRLAKEQEKRLSAVSPQVESPSQPNDKEKDRRASNANAVLSPTGTAPKRESSHILPPPVEETVQPSSPPVAVVPVPAVQPVSAPPITSPPKPSVVPPRKWYHVFPCCRAPRD